MRVYSLVSESTKPCAVALGNFDGVHLGHRAVVEAVIGRTGLPTVLTFDPHPREFFGKETGFLLTPGSEKLELIAESGISQVVVAPFGRELAATEAQDFMIQFLSQGLQAQFISVGWNFRFGKGRLGTTEMLQTFAREKGFDIEILAERRLSDARVSSSAIRVALSEGNLPLAHQLLGRPYSLGGEVIPGDQRGRQLGFPTANLRIDPRKFLPANGVYLVKVGEPDAWGLMNIGMRPTFDGLERRVEVHLLNFEGDLYGKSLRVSLQKFLRPERKFAVFEELIAQIRQDKAEALAWIAAL
ncbi:MAG: bifunctional riboflavin kinase/FAD synthetase [Anaerolineae bacterium]|nr:bifunctional riboflavin kinase/FAD synthetase [Gloeobacterales cyanobacterium ES-bin-313]